ncbi:MAG: hypothetical protein ACKPJJ_11300, partial [Planctomycetaceae bacterium]
LVVQPAADGLRFSTTSAAVVPAGSLCFSAAGVQQHSGTICFDSALYADPLQPLSAAESGCGGVLCEADPGRQQLSVRPCAVEVLRFARERLSCPDGTTPEELLSLLHAASRSLAGSRGTTVVEWEIDGRLSVAGSSGARLCEAERLRDLRASLRAGHAGAWPARIRFSYRSELSLEAGWEVL